MRLALLAALAAGCSTVPRPGAQTIPAAAFEPVRGGQVSSVFPNEPDPAPTSRAPWKATGSPAPESVVSPAAPGHFLPPLLEAQEWALARLGSVQYACLDAIVRYESRWRLDAVNRSSGAFGLFQALPASKLDRYGRDAWGQMRFGLAYIAARYRSACRGWRHIEAVGWY